MFDRIRYRVMQGLRSMRATLSPLPYEAITPYLTPALLDLFKTMTKADQYHGIQVVRMLRKAGHDHPDLMVAALLHDVGKAKYPYRLPARTLAILGRQFFPEWAAKRAQGEPSGFGRAFVVYERHPVWSAEILKEAGASDLAVELALRHQEPLPPEPVTEREKLTAALRWADDKN